MNKETSNKIDWVFASTGGGDETGFNDPATTIFRGNIPYFIAREPLQNIIDAGITFPVKASFDQISVNVLDIPKIEQLEKVCRACKKFYSEDIRRNEDCVMFFDSIIKKIIGKKKINLLKISDENTSGMSPKDYNNFMRAVGSSSKETQKGGSFGLGKGAYFAASNFKTIFLSSIFNENNNHLFAGKARLVSFRENDEIMQGNGTFGIDKQEPVIDVKLIPEFFKRSKPGTDVFIVDFDQGDNWYKEIIKSVLVNFWLRILEGKLEVSVHGTNITADNLEALIYEYFQNESVKNNKHEQNPIPYYEAYTNEKSLVFPGELSTIGKVTLHVLIKEGYPKHISYIRNTGMVIQKKFHPSSIQYAGVFICDNSDAVPILRGMENPQHDDWSAEHAKDGQPTQLAKKVEREMKQFIREKLNSLVTSEDKVRFSIKGTEDYLTIPFNEEDNTEEKYSSESEDVVGEKESAERVGSEKVADLNSHSNDPYRFKPLVHTRKPNPKPNPRPKPKPDPKPRPDPKPPKDDKSLKEVKDFKARSFAIVNENGDCEHIAILRSEPNKKILRIVVGAGSEDSLVALPIKYAMNKNTGEKYSVKGDAIEKVTMDKEGACQLIIKFADNEKYSLNITAYTNENN